MFIFVQNFKSNKPAVYTPNECSADVECAREYAERLLNSSVDVASVELYRFEGEVAKVEKAEWS